MPLTPQEEDELRKLIPFAEHLRNEAEYKSALKLLTAKSRSIVVIVASTIAALIVLKDQIKEVMRWFVQ